MTKPKVGDRVIIVGSHPWSGHAGKFVREEFIKTLEVTRPVIKLDNGISCFVMNPSQFRRVG